MADSPIVSQASDLVSAAWTRVCETDEYKAMQRTKEYAIYRALDDALQNIKNIADGDVIPVKSKGLLARFADLPPVQQSRTRASQVGLAVHALRVANRPMTTSELLIAVERYGGAVGGDNPELNLSSSLSRSDEVESVRFNGVSHWRLTDRAATKKTATDQ